MGRVNKTNVFALVAYHVELDKDKADIEQSSLSPTLMEL